MQHIKEDVTILVALEDVCAALRKRKYPDEHVNSPEMATWNYCIDSGIARLQVMSEKGEI